VLNKKENVVPGVNVKPESNAKVVLVTVCSDSPPFSQRTVVPGDTVSKSGL
jgi:hypothetical protein